MVEQGIQVPGGLKELEIEVGFWSGAGGPRSSTGGEVRGIRPTFAIKIRHSMENLNVSWQNSRPLRRGETIC